MTADNLDQQKCCPEMKVLPVFFAHDGKSSQSVSTQKVHGGVTLHGMDVTEKLIHLDLIFINSLLISDIFRTWRTPQQ